VLVQEVMTPNPITVRPDSDYLAAIALMRAGRFRHLPVVDEQGNLVGLVSERDLRTAKPAAPTPKAVIGDGVLLRVKEVMKRNLITTTPDFPLEEAASVMIRHRIGCLPVIKDGSLVGIITDTDLFRQFVAILGGGSQTLRLTVQVDNTPGQLAALAGRIAAVNGNIHSIASHPAPTPERSNFTLRVEGISLETLLEAVRSHPGLEVLSFWTGEK
jgi:acetoin utilization protein AcuB